MPDTNATTATVPVTTADTSLICIAHCPFQKGKAFGLSNVKQCRVSKKQCSIYGHLQTWHRFQTPACRIIIDAIKKQLPTSTNLHIDEATVYFLGEAPSARLTGACLSSPPVMPDLHNLSNDNEDQSAGEDENVSPSVPSAATVTKKKTAVSTRNDVPVMASNSPSPVSSPPRIAARKSMKKPSKVITRKRVEDDDENTSEEEDGYVAMALPVTVCFR
ncbi:unnamed protein product [Rotaria sp. Silwood2]|nr:unnamed protein product [Rotaria sp. Silwood2]CAF2763544.1 unnamed protein product [Rotaria sp. Silwood2]CAF3176611.1 unnamed protein product [Rotaria sp. Silwood2]CAF4426016.1 unnamed protein product [Rotaria sp. Silwood2]CAF4430477.1 unnamed protein product [Rotaria sp. Silwood2]